MTAILATLSTSHSVGNLLDTAPGKDQPILVFEFVYIVTGKYS